MRAPLLSKVAGAVLLAIFLISPVTTLGATLAADDSLNVSVSPTDNAYLAGTEVRVNAELPADLLAAAGTLLITAPIQGDALLLAGTIDVTSPVGGDVRAAGGRVVIEGDVGGDVAGFAGAFTMTGKAKEVRAAGGTVELRGGAAGPVTVYAGSVYLSGEFSGDVRIVASDHVTLGEGTIIRGVFEYNAPQEAGIPPSALVEGGVRYTGSSSFLPTEEEARTFALAGLGIFFVVRLVAGALAAGLIAGLFPSFARRLTDEALARSWKRFVLLMLLGFAILVATPVLILLLLASFVGIGIAALIGAAYLLAILLSYLYAALFAGALIMKLTVKRMSVSWKSAILGTVVLYFLGLIPGVGLLIAFVLSAVSLGAMALLFYRASFGRGEIG
jgi:hypothetical protein